MEFHPKFTLDVQAFADRIERVPQLLRHLVLALRSLGRAASARAAAAPAAPFDRSSARP